MPRRRKPDPPRLSDAEWDVMNAVWDREPVTAQEVADALCDARDWSPRTVKTLLARLVRKGALAYEVDGKRYVYGAVFPRDVCQRAEGRHFLEKVLGGSPHPLLAYFVREGRLSAEELDELRQLIEEREEER